MFARRGRNHPPCGVPFHGRKERFAIDNPSLQPCLEDSPHERESLEFVQEGVLVDAVEALRYISIEDVFG